MERDRHKVTERYRDGHRDGDIEEGSGGSNSDTDRDGDAEALDELSFKAGSGLCKLLRDVTWMMRALSRLPLCFVKRREARFAHRSCPLNLESMAVAEDSRMGLRPSKRLGAFILYTGSP